jgi:serpin B
MKIRIVSLLTAALILGSLMGCMDQAPAAPRADIDQIVKGNTAFALDLYAKLRDQKGNLFLSPYSISTALAMTYGGARGQTAEEMAKTLHFLLDAGQLHPAFASLEAQLTASKSKGYQLDVANALWGQKGKSFLPDFLASTRQNYRAGFREVDFQATEAARQTINTWVENQTNDKIHELLKPGVITGDTELVLTNAIYFKGKWVDPFPKARTKEEDFQLGAGNKVKAPLMHQKKHYRYLDGKDFQALELPYVGDALAMVVLLPRKADGLPNFERVLTPDKLQGWLNGLNSEEVEVTLPKFRLTSEFRLDQTLASLGMARVFTGGEADFSGMDGKQDLFLSAVVHQAFVDVNEEGTEAAAATGAVMTRMALRLDLPVFRADHPFLFLIRDTHSGSILFLGRLTDPRS